MNLRDFRKFDNYDSNNDEDYDPIEEVDHADTMAFDNYVGGNFNSTEET